MLEARVSVAVAGASLLPPSGVRAALDLALVVFCTGEGVDTLLCALCCCCCCLPSISAHLLTGSADPWGRYLTYFSTPPPPAAAQVVEEVVGDAPILVPYFLAKGEEKAGVPPSSSKR